MIKSESHNSCGSLTHRAGVSGEIKQQDRRADDHAWIDVIHQMDSIYADLVHYQVELEDKNAKLEDAQSFIESVIFSISDILIACDINRSIQQVNRALEEATGREGSELTG